MNFTYINGDKARYTGKTLTLHGGLFYEVVMVEGHMKGQTKVTQRAPKAAVARGLDASLDPDLSTEICGHIERNRENAK